MNKTLIRYSMLLPLLFSACASAKDSADGTWKLDAVKSYWTDGNMPKNMSLTVRVNFDKGSIDYSSVNDTDPQKPTALSYQVPMDSKPYPLPEHGSAARYNLVSVFRMGPHDFQLLKMKGDDVVVGEFWTFSPDGKHLVRKGVGKSSEGKSKAFVEYFDRVPAKP